MHGVPVNIRTERTEDIAQITDVVRKAFKNHPQSNQKEHLLVSGLRKEEALTVSLVAESKGKIIGHIAFSEVTIDGENCDWHGLAPVSVAPEFQNMGIGSKLIWEGLDTIKKLGAEGCVLLGEPEYYHRFGFRHRKELSLEGVHPEYFLSIAFGKVIPNGVVEYHPIFSTYG